MKNKKVVIFGVFDGLHVGHLFLIQKDKILNDNLLRKGNKFFLEGTLALNEIENNGYTIDSQVLSELDLELSNKMDDLLKSIENSSEAKLYESKTYEKFNFNSGKQLGHLLFDLLQYPAPKLTNSGAYQTDAEVLEKIDNPMIKNIMAWKKIKKIKDTYLGQYKLETDNSKLHPFFNLNTVSSYRSSASNPNLQNTPKRDKTAQYYTRKMIVPRAGNFLLGADYKAVEVGVGACYHKDPNMINYVIDPASDMHYDMAVQLFKKDRSQITKNERQAAKNGMVFPSFYGSYFEQTAPGVWEQIEQDTKDHLKTKGIKNFMQFKDHIQQVEKWLWTEMFPDYSQWKRDIWEFYKKNGYIELFTGFRCTDVMRKNQACNMQIQGSAFHVLLWSLIELQKEFKSRNFKSQIIGQIHDALYFDIYPPEFDIIRPLIKEVMINRVMNKWKWIIVPLRVELEKCEVGQSYADLKDFGSI
jgi:DNA polymerase-1